MHERNKVPSEVDGPSAASIAMRLSRNFLWTFLGDGASKGVIFFAALYLARTLTSSGLGLFDFAQAIARYTWILADLGIVLYGAREVARNRSDAGPLLNTFNSARLTMAILIGSIFVLVLWSIPITPELRWLLLAAQLVLLANAMNPDWFLRGMEQIRLIAFGNLTTGVLFIFCLLIFVRGPLDSQKAVMSWPIAVLCGSILMLTIVWRNHKVVPKFKLDLQSLRHHLPAAVTVGVSGSVILAYTYLGSLLIGLLLGPERVGIFSAPQRLVILMGNLLFIIPLAFFPVLASLTGQLQKTLLSRFHDQLVNTMILLGIPLGIVGFLVSPQIIGLLYGQGFAESVPLLRLMIWLVPLTCVRFAYGSALLAVGFQKQHVITSTAALVATAVIGYFATLSSGPAGTAFSWLVGETILLSGMAFSWNIRVLESNWGQHVTFALTVIGISFLLSLPLMLWQLPGVYPVLLGAAAYALTIILVAWLHRNSLDWLQLWQSFFRPQVEAD